jgi:hypothetical protein
MKKVFTADKRSYGTGFFEICDSLEELKKAIVKNYYQYRGVGPKDRPTRYSDDMYSEDLFLRAKKEGRYILYEIDLHDEEEILFHEYDGTSDHYIAKKEVNILSTSTQLSPYA